MPRTILLSLFALLVGDASAQYRGGAGFGFGRSGFVRSGLRQGQFHRGPFVIPYGAAYGDYGLPYDVGAPYGYSPQPIVIVVQQPAPPPIVQEPPREAHSVIINYAQSAPGPAAPAEGEPPTLGIVLKNGSTRSAIAVVVGTSDGMLHYIDPDDRDMRISMTEVDRAATQKLNRERKLPLWLPSTPQSTAAPAPGH